MTYEVKYKLKDSWFFKSIKNVKGDLVSPDISNLRIFICDNEDRFEVPIEGTVFWFSKDRFLLIKRNMEKESGVKL